MNRRNFLGGFGSLSTVLILSGCSESNRPSLTQLKDHTPTDEQEKHEEVSAVEDLMREHGILRRLLFVYSEAAERMRSGNGAALLENLHKAAGLFRSFGEDYHEKKLEEKYIFPAVKKSGGKVSAYPDILTVQHNRGREITDYILATTKGSKLDTDDAEALTQRLDSFVRMYRAHAAREDTVVFPAWKKTLTVEQLDEMNETFEDIEHDMFGEDGFEKAVSQTSDIEHELGLADLMQFTAPPLKGR